jgi:hypothetical protein
MIPEPQKTYLLGLLAAPGPAGDEFVLVGGQALKFILAEASATEDFDLLLDAISLRERPANVADTLTAPEYSVVPESRNFQFQKPLRCTNNVTGTKHRAGQNHQSGNRFPKGCKGR